MKSFSSKIDIIGINPYVSVPDSVLTFLLKQSGKTACPIPVHGTINGQPFIQTVVRYAGVVRLYINGPMLKSAGVKLGDIVKIKLEFDPKPRIPPMHPKLKNALAKNKEAQAIFNRFPPSHQREILKYINSMKTEASVERNVEKVIEHLLGKKTEGLKALMLKKT